MTEFGPNKTRGQYFCLRIVIMLLIIALLVFGTCCILFISQQKVAEYVNASNRSARDAYSSFDGLVNIKCVFNSAGDKESENEVVKFKQEDSFVDTKSGRLQGIKKNVFGNYVHQFLGVPYAMPPVGQMRFKRPVAVETWNHTLKVNKLRANCLQYFDPRLAGQFHLLANEMSEDCLYLNIWTPTVNRTALKAIMIFIHGGGFTEGSVNIDENIGEVLALYGDVVVVTFNYRVGALGFLDLGVDESPGNQGLYDQAMALRWVKDNAQYFGGDPDSITLFGVSSGAISIGLHMVSPETKTLFKRAILQSGSPAVVNAYYSSSANVAQKVAELLDCVKNENNEEGNVEEIDVLPIHKDVESVLKCLRSKSVLSLIEAQKQIITNSSFTFTPSPYEDMLPIMPTDAIKEKVVPDAFSSIHEVLMGLTKDEASMFLHLHSPDEFTTYNITKEISSIQETQELFVDIVSSRNVRKSSAQFLANLFIKNDTNESEIDYVKKLHTALSDLAFNCPAIVFAQELAKANKSIYFYVYNHRSSGHPNIADWMGVPHLALMPFVFGHPLRYPTRYSGADIEVSKRIMQSWSYFAKTGKSLPQMSTEWRPFSVENQDYIEIATNNATMKHKYHEKACEVFRLGFDTID